jgi:hypothetical protein
MPDGNSSSWNTLRDNLRTAIDNVVILRVTTVIGAITIDAAHCNDDSATTSVTIAADGAECGHTVINTVLGDCTYSYTPNFFANTAMMQAHADAVQAAHTVRRETIEIMKSALKELETLLKG